MKHIKIVSVALLAILVVALLVPVPAYLQESPLPTPAVEPIPEPEPGPVELPETAVGALALLIAGLGAMGGIVTEWGTELIKRLPFIKPADREKISGNWAKFVAGLVALVTTGVQAYGILGAEWLDENGIWALVLLAFNWAGADLLHRVMRRTKRNPGEILSTIHEAVR